METSRPVSAHFGFVSNHHIPHRQASFLGLKVRNAPFDYQRSEMHPCLQVPELLLNIFYHFVEDKEGGRTTVDRRTLAALTLTCKDFTEPALDALWHTMTYLTPLFKLLPEHRFQVRCVQTGMFLSGPRLFLQNDVQAADFTRWQYYSFRIKSLDLNYRRSPCSQVVVDSTAYDILLSANPTGAALLPNIRDVTMSLSDVDQATSLLRLILTRDTRRVFVEEGTDVQTQLLDPEPWQRMVDLLHQQNVGGGMRELSIKLRHFWDDMSIVAPSSITRELLTYSGLTKLAIPSFELVDVSVLALIGLLPLQEVTLNITSMPEISSLPLTPDGHRGYFVTLEKATLLVSDPAVLTSFVRNWNATKLEALTVDHALVSSVWNLDEIFEYLGRHLPSATLRLLALSKTHGARSEHLISDLSYDAVAFLFPLHRLVNVSLNLGGRNVLKDGELKLIAAAWPLLESLEISERE